MKLRYIGLKVDGETGFARESGIERWFMGDEKEVVDTKVAEKMIAHRDMWEKVETDAAPIGGLSDADPPRRPHTPLYDNTKVVLLHTALLPDTFTIKDRVVTQAEAIQHAFHEDADITEEQWNALTDEERADRIKVALEHIETGEGHPDAPVALVAEGLAALDDEALRAICKERKFKVHHTKKGDALRTAILEAQSAEAAQAAKG
ncbi:hypothetical protein [Methylibium petroleiphilum]